MTPAPRRRTRRDVSVPVVAALHVAGGVGLALAVAAQGSAVTLAMGLAAYTLGLRHAFDADHIAAIDTTTRRLVREGKDARAVGLWFSLGHSTVVLGLAVVLLLGARTIAPMLRDDGSALLRMGAVWGPAVSGTFLVALAGTNVLLLVRDLRRGTATVTAHRHVVGPVSWLSGRLGWAVDRPVRMYAVGLLFGLGLDTAAEIGLVVLTASTALDSPSVAAALSLPLLFAAGMSLLDSTQATVARRAYVAGRTGRRAMVGRYDVVVTGVTALVAGVVGAATLTNLLAERVLAPSHSPFVLDVAPYGYALTAALLLAWAAGLLLARRPRLLSPYSGQSRSARDRTSRPHPADRGYASRCCRLSSQVPEPVAAHRAARRAEGGRPKRAREL